MMKCHCYCITPDDEVSLLLYYTRWWSVTVTVLHPMMMYHYYCITPDDDGGGGGVEKNSVPTLHSSQRASQFQCAAPFPFTTQWHTYPHSPVLGAWFVCSPWGSEVAPPSGDQTLSAGWPCRADRPPSEQQNHQHHQHQVCPNGRTFNTIIITFVQTAAPSTPSSSRLSKQQNRQHHHHHICPNSRTVNTIIITFVQTAELFVHTAAPSTPSSSRLSKHQNRQHHHHHICPTSSTVNTIIMMFVQTAEPSTPSHHKIEQL